MLMLRMPATPSKGAMIFSRARWPAPAKLGFGHRRLAELSSTARWAMNFSSTSSWLRRWLARAIETSASACFTSPSAAGRPVHQQLAAPHALGVAEVDLGDAAGNFRPPHTLWRERRLPTAARRRSCAGSRPAPLRPKVRGGSAASAAGNARSLARSTRGRSRRLRIRRLRRLVLEPPGRAGSRGDPTTATTVCIALRH